MNNRILLRYHSFLGLIAGVFLFTLGITGSVLVFSEDIDLLLFDKYTATISTNELQLDKAISEVQKNFPGWSTRIINFERGKIIQFDLRKLDVKQYVFLNPISGKITAVIDANSQLTKWLLKFHYSLQIGILGKIFMFLAGIAFFLSLITGIVIYRKVILKTLLFQKKLNRSSKQRYYSTLHRYVGVWALMLNLLIVLTGIILSFNVVASGLQETSKPTVPLIRISIEKVLEKVKKEYPDFTATYIKLPSSEDGKVILNGRFAGDSFYLSKYYNKIAIEFKTGKIVSVSKISESDFISKLLSSILPIHSGHYGNWFIKIIYCFIGLSGPFLSITGYFIWLKRKKVV
ncbi:PepSY-associated TM helix domain-containing protein [Flavobacterium sp. 7A]|uniref:PepSY-associated TM helix domain-containing protein n=1 Tax=Flavobacterium sp. 7A TaxID=2940571 RepID=UPI0022265D40|nr:PepSY-associated TM helix domain-containing protein [Flavobacterium sp. 7A]MCW2118580.1 putative iron-regulated membrane protein [Flavobacterium sp. 7A]